MGFIPSIKLREALTKAGVGLWVEQLGDGRIALVCKAPETAIKALYRGAACTFLLSTIQAESLTILCIGLRVNDEPESTFKASMVNCSPEDAALLTQILESRATTLHFFNELNHPILSAWCSLAFAIKVRTQSINRQDADVFLRQFQGDIAAGKLEVFSIGGRSLLGPSCWLSVTRSIHAFCAGCGSTASCAGPAESEFSGSFCRGRCDTL